MGAIYYFFTLLFEKSNCLNKRDIWSDLTAAAAAAETNKLSANNTIADRHLIGTAMRNTSVASQHPPHLAGRSWDTWRYRMEKWAPSSLP